MLFYRLKRLKQFFSLSLYRRVIYCRLLCGLLHRLNPGLRYLGLTIGNTTTFMFLHDNVVTPWTVASGEFQGDDFRHLLSLCDSLGAPLGGVFLDIGANIGTSTLYALRSGRFASAVCVEPAPANLTLLNLNLQVNNLADRAMVHAAAVSDRAGRLSLRFSKSNCGDHRLSTAPVDPKGEATDVDVISLDDLLNLQGIGPETVSLVWVDTQGHEGFVLSGAAKLIDQGVPFSIEFWPQALQEAGCYAKLLTMIERDFDRFVDLAQKKAPTIYQTKDIRNFAKRFEGTVYHTDLLLLPRNFKASCHP